MTEEEKAEEYAKKSLKGFREYIYLDQAETKIEDVYLAGLHEGQPKWHNVADKIPTEGVMLLLARKTVNNNKQALIGYYKNGKFERFNERTGLIETIDSVYAWKFIDLPEIKE